MLFKIFELGVSPALGDWALKLNQRCSLNAAFPGTVRPGHAISLRVFSCNRNRSTPIVPFHSHVGSCGVNARLSRSPVQNTFPNTAALPRAADRRNMFPPNSRRRSDRLGLPSCCEDTHRPQSSPYRASYCGSTTATISTCQVLLSL